MPDSLTNMGRSLQTLVQMEDGYKLYVYDGVLYQDCSSLPYSISRTINDTVYGGYNRTVVLDKILDVCIEFEGKVSSLPMAYKACHSEEFERFVALKETVARVLSKIPILTSVYSCASVADQISHITELFAGINRTLQNVEIDM